MRSPCRGGIFRLHRFPSTGRPPSPLPAPDNEHGSPFLVHCICKGWLATVLAAGIHVLAFHRHATDVGGVGCVNNAAARPVEIAKATDRVFLRTRLWGAIVRVTRSVVTDV